MPDGEKQPTLSSCSLGMSRRVIGSKTNPANTSCSLATNIIVSSMLILGGAATVTDLTGMSTIAVRANYFTIFADAKPIQGLFPDPYWRGYLCRRWGNAIDVIMRLVSQIYRVHLTSTDPASQYTHDRSVCNYPCMF